MCLRRCRMAGSGSALAVLMIVLFLTFLDNTVVSVALGSVQSDLHDGVTALQWVISAYALTFAVATDRPDTRSATPSITLRR